MQEQRAHQIIEALANGADPLTGESLPPGSPLQQPDVVRALLAAKVALEDRLARAARRTQLPRNVGAPWTVEEEKELVAAFEADTHPLELAERHGRTLAAIEYRLQRLGKIKPEERITRDRHAPRGPQPKDR